MTATQKVLALLAAVFLLSGAPGILRELRQPGLQRTVALGHGALVLAGLGGFFLTFANSPGLSRALSLVSVGLASLIYATDKLRLAFPALVRFPLTFGSRYSSGQFHLFGINVVPAALFVAIWVVGKKLRVREGVRDS